jgi:SOS-response transcriptional repressor LexA
MTERLSKREVEVLNFIRIHGEKFGRAPYQYEIAASLGLRSCTYVQRILVAMIRKGVITKTTRQKAWAILPGTKFEAQDRNRVLKLLPPDTLAVVEAYARAEGASVETIIAEWVNERAIHESQAKARAA